MDMNYRGGMWEGGDGQVGVEWGGKWDNCNSILNKYIKKKLHMPNSKLVRFRKIMSLRKWEETEMMITLFVFRDLDIFEDYRLVIL